MDYLDAERLREVIVLVDVGLTRLLALPEPFCVGLENVHISEYTSPRGVLTGQTRDEGEIPRLRAFSKVLHMALPLVGVPIGISRMAYGSIYQAIS